MYPALFSDFQNENFIAKRTVEVDGNVYFVKRHLANSSPFFDSIKETCMILFWLFVHCDVLFGTPKLDKFMASPSF